LRTKTTTALPFGATYDSALDSSGFSALVGTPIANDRQTKHASQGSNIEAFTDKTFPRRLAPPDYIALRRQRTCLNSTRVRLLEIVRRIFAETIGGRSL
jgi:hypothetical protein